MYSQKSCIQPIFHLKEKPNPSPPISLVTFGHAVDSLGNCHKSGIRSTDDEFRWWRELNGLQILVATEFIRQPSPSFFTIIQI